MGALLCHRRQIQPPSSIAINLHIHNTSSASVQTGAVDIPQAFSISSASQPSATQPTTAEVHTAPSAPAANNPAVAPVGCSSAPAGGGSVVVARGRHRFRLAARRVIVLLRLRRTWSRIGARLQILGQGDVSSFARSLRSTFVVLGNYLRTLKSLFSHLERRKGVLQCRNRRG